ncbi:MAG: hypothetical protein Q4A60_09515, partial [Pasteurellaceae bacterium]|nr:hypothetical protein [Pasteurellaceae bacterium]
RVKPLKAWWWNVILCGETRDRCLLVKIAVSHVLFFQYGIARACGLIAYLTFYSDTSVVLPATCEILLFARGIFMCKKCKIISKPRIMIDVDRSK